MVGWTALSGRRAVGVEVSSCHVSGLRILEDAFVALSDTSDHSRTTETLFHP